MILRTITCEVCGQTYTEEAHGNGFPGWGALQGITLDGVDNPTLCPAHKAVLADCLDQLKQQHQGGSD